MAELQITQTRFWTEKCLSSIPPKHNKYRLNVHKIKGAHCQYVNNHYAKFENKGMETFGVTDYTK